MSNYESIQANNLNDLEKQLILIGKNIKLERKEIDNESFSSIIKALNLLYSSGLGPSSYTKLLEKAIMLMKSFVESYDHLSLLTLYEKVQSVEKITPRFYLSIYIASCCISNNLLPLKETWEELNEFIKGVQHPIRGFYLRNYLLSTFLIRSEKDGEEKELFPQIFQTLSQMNALWVRLEQIKITKEKDQNKKEMQEIGQTFAKGISSMPSLPITSEMYSNLILPQIIIMIQEHPTARPRYIILKALINSFPPLHILQSEDNVNLNSIFMQIRILPSSKDLQVDELFLNLLNKIYAVDDIDSLVGKETIVQSINEEFSFYQTNIKPQVMLNISLFFCKFILKFKVFGNLLPLLTSISARISSLETLSLEDCSNIKLLLTLSISYPFERVLEANEPFALLLNRLPPQDQSSIATLVLESLTSNNFQISNIDLATVVFKKLLYPLFVNKIPVTEEMMDEELNSSEILLMKAMNMVKSLDVSKGDAFLSILISTRKMIISKSFGKDSIVSNIRLPVIFVPFIFHSLSFSNLISSQTDVDEPTKRTILRKIFQFVHDIIMNLKDLFPCLAVKLLLSVALGSKDSIVSLEFLNNVFDLLNKHPNISKLNKIFIIFIDSLASINNIEWKSLNTFICDKVVNIIESKFPDNNQPYLLHHLAMVFYNMQMMDDKNNYGNTLLEIIGKSLDLAAKHLKMESRILFYIDILNMKCFFLSKANFSFITKAQLSALLKLIEDSIAKEEKSNEGVIFLKNTMSRYEEEIMNKV